MRNGTDQQSLTHLPRRQDLAPGGDLAAPGVVSDTALAIPNRSSKKFGARRWV